MASMCPISLKSVNEKAVQINAALTVLMIVLFLFTPHKWIILVLTIDFFVRGFLDASYSFFGSVSRMILRFFNSEPTMVDAGPKIFAAKIGFMFCCLIGAFYLMNWLIISVILSCIFAFFAGLEAIFKFCVACKIYPFVCKRKATQ
jgi:hypothetical protein